MSPLIRLAESSENSRRGFPQSGKTADPSLGAWDQLVREQLERWQPPILSDAEIELYGKLFLMRPGHDLMPFFLWLDEYRFANRLRAIPE